MQVRGGCKAQNMTVLGSRVFTDVFKGSMEMQSYPIRVAPRCSGSVSVGERGAGEMGTC